MTADSDPPLVTLFCWPLTEADDVDAALAGAGDDDDDDDADDADSAEQDDDGQDDDGQDDDGQDDDDLDRSEGEPAETQPNAAGTTPGAGAAPSAAPGAAVPAAPAAPAASADPAQVPAATVPGIGRVPFGFRRRGTRLILHPEEAPIVRTILAAQAQGRTVDLIEAAVAEAHGPWVRAHWAAKEVQRHIRRILDRARFYERHLGVGVPAP
jgi:hypothetical protein